MEMTQFAQNSVDSVAECESNKDYISSNYKETQVRCKRRSKRLENLGETPTYTESESRSPSPSPKREIQDGKNEKLRKKLVKKKIKDIVSSEMPKPKKKARNPFIL